jgi:hypothetical protein
MTRIKIAGIAILFSINVILAQYQTDRALCSFGTTVRIGSSYQSLKTGEDKIPIGIIEKEKK